MIVRTVLGDVEPSELGPCDAHEHLFLDTPAQPGEEFVDREKAVEEARTLAAAGARAVVDWTPLGLGRDLDGLALVSRETGLHVVAATGLHRDAHYRPDSEFRTASVDDLADRFAAELRDRCGILKLGASYHHLTPFEQKAFEAGAEAHRRTGAPVCVHTQHGTMGLQIVERLAALGVPPASIVLAHVDRNPDAGEHAETTSAAAGCCAPTAAALASTTSSRGSSRVSSASSDSSCRSGSSSPTQREPSPGRAEGTARY